MILFRIGPNTHLKWRLRWESGRHSKLAWRHIVFWLIVPEQDICFDPPDAHHVHDTANNWHYLKAQWCVVISAVRKLIQMVIGCDWLTVIPIIGFHRKGVSSLEWHFANSLWNWKHQHRNYVLLSFYVDVPCDSSFRTYIDLYLWWWCGQIELPSLIHSPLRWLIADREFPISFIAINSATEETSKMGEKYRTQNVQTEIVLVFQLQRYSIFARRMMIRS